MIKVSKTKETMKRRYTAFEDDSFSLARNTHQPSANKMLPNCFHLKQTF
jgi:hypothetical protein